MCLVSRQAPGAALGWKVILVLWLQVEMQFILISPKDLLRTMHGLVTLCNINMLFKVCFSCNRLNKLKTKESQRTTALIFLALEPDRITMDHRIKSNSLLHIVTGREKSYILSLALKPQIGLVTFLFMYNFIVLVHSHHLGSVVSCPSRKLSAKVRINSQRTTCTASNISQTQLTSNCDHRATENRIFPQELVGTKNRINTRKNSVHGLEGWALR